MAKAQIEPIAGIVRVFNDDEAKYGDKFDWSATIRYINREEIEVCAYMTEIKPSIYKAIFAECRRQGIKRILAVNYPNGSAGERKTRWFNVPSPIERLYSEDIDDDATNKVEDVN